MIQRYLPWALIGLTLFTAAMIGSGFWAYLIMSLGYLAGRLWPRARKT